MAQIFACSVARMASLTVAGFMAGACFVSSSAKAAGESKKTPEAVPGEFVVELREQIRTTDFESLSQRLGVEVVDSVRSNLIVVRSAAGTASAKRLETKLRDHPLVSRIEPNFIYRAFGFRSLKTPNDPDFSKTWGLKNTGGADSAGTVGIAGIDIGAEAAWEYTTGDKKVVVAVIDTGVDFGHPDLKSQAWVNSKEAKGQPGVDDDGNGYVDDLNGYNFVDNKGDATDDNAHGSHCAGTIGAKGGDGKGIVGVNWNVSIMAVKFLSKDGGGTLANAIKSIDYATKNGADIMSNSWGGGAASAILKTAISDANKAGILFVVAAGNDSNDNDSTPTYPSSYDVDNVLSVAALDNRGAFASFSNFGATSVHVAAPGVNIVSSVLKGGYDSYSGTSMATPHVAGIAALLLAHNSNYTHLQLKKRIMDSARPLYTLRKRVSTAGIADAQYALSGATPPRDPNDPASLPNVTRYSYSTDHPYKEGVKLEHKITIRGAKKLAIRFSKFDTEIGYDTLSFYDGRGKYVASISGVQEDGVMSPVIEGDTAVLKFAADETVSSYGFDIEAVLSE